MLCGSAFKNKGVQPLLDAVVDFLPAPADREAYRGIDPKTATRPCAGLRHRAARHARLQDHGFEHVGSITFAASTGPARKRHAARQHHAREEGAGRAAWPHARRRPRGDQGGLRRRHRQPCRAQGHAHRRDAVRSAEAGHPREDGVPQPRHRDEDRAQDQGRPGEERTRCDAGAEDPSFRVTPDQESARPSSRAWASCTSTSRSTS